MENDETKMRHKIMTEMKDNETKRLEAECKRWFEPFRLKHSKIDDFTSSPCFSTPYVLCAIRAVAATYFISWWLFNMSANMEEGKMFIYFSNICFTFITFYFVFGFNLSCISIKQKRDELYEKKCQSYAKRRPLAMSFGDDERLESQPINKFEENDLTISESITLNDDEGSNRVRSLSPTIEYRHDLLSHLTIAESIEEEDDYENVNRPSSSEIPESPKYNKLSVCYQVYWLLFYISSSCSVLLTLGYWYNILEDKSSFINSLTKHVITMVFVVMEFLLSRIPVYLSHMIYPLVFTTLYNVFTLLYWASGGTDPDGRSYIYDVLNYNHISFKRVIIPTLTTVLLQPLIHAMFLAVAVARNCVGNKLCCRRKLSN